MALLVVSALGGPAWAATGGERDVAPEAVEETEPNSRHGVWAYPLASIVMGATGSVLYIPIGFETELGSDKTLIIELAPIAAGDFFYPCDAPSQGAIASVGPGIYLNRTTTFRGPLLQPKVRGRVFHTGAPRDRACTATHVGPIEGWDAEVGLGTDVGYAWGPRNGNGLYAAIAIGFSVNLCINCLGATGASGVFFDEIPASYYSDDLIDRLPSVQEETRYERWTRASWAANFNLLRLGYVW